MNEGRVPSVLSLGRRMSLKVRGLHFERYRPRQLPMITDSNRSFLVLPLARAFPR